MDEVIAHEELIYDRYTTIHQHREVRERIEILVNIHVAAYSCVQPPGRIRSWCVRGGRGRRRGRLIAAGVNTGEDGEDRRHSGDKTDIKEYPEKKTEEFPSFLGACVPSFFAEASEERVKTRETGPETGADEAEDEGDESKHEWEDQSTGENKMD